MENEEVSIIEVDMESFKAKKDGIINSFLGYDHKDPIHKDNVKKDLRGAFKDGTVLMLE
ncbi:MAG: hypothetical protein FWD37_02090 [Methanomassiliicoccaceae archaeon]|nr:hypothetical protein [Methanomassiliicoccaceae archaeon]